MAMSPLPIGSIVVSSCLRIDGCYLAMIFLRYVISGHETIPVGGHRDKK